MASTDRISTLDGVRGVAVMGILAMNIVAFAMPEAAYDNPLVWGHRGDADLWSWAAAFVLVDGKMRGLFSMLFGASMLLMYQRGVAAGEDADAMHRRRMAWLLAFGLIHYYLIWDGDILALYALCGLVGLAMVHLDARTLIRLAVLLSIAAMTLYVALALSMYATERDGLAAGASAADIADYRSLMRDLGGPGSAATLAREIALFGGGYGGIVAHRIGPDWSGPLEVTFVYGLETLGLMALGMAFLRNGFLAGEWTRSAYARFASVCYAIGVPPLILLAFWCWRAGFEPVTVAGSTIAWSMPFRFAVMLGHAALIILLIKRWADTAPVARIEAVGRTAFSNYLGTSIVMTLVFYGYGLGLFGQLSRWQAYLACLPAWAAMLCWSKPWLESYRYGPLEWLWRSLSRGRLEKMRR